MGELSSAGGTALGATIGGVLGLAGNAISSAQNDKYARQQMALQHQYNEDSANNADARTRALYNDLYSPQARMKQIIEAGLSPSAMYAEGLGGGQGQAGAQGQGVGNAGGTGFPMDLAGSAAAWAQAMSQIRLQDAQRKKIEIENADDPTIKTYIAEKQQAITDANKTESEQVNSAYNTLMQQMVNIGYHASNVSFTKSHAEGSSESDASGWTLSVSDAHGQSHSFNVGGSVSANVGIKGAGGSISGNYGKSEGHNEAHAEGKGENTAHSWSKNVADTISEGKGQSGNKTELIQLLETFYNQMADAGRSAEASRKEARDNYDYRVKQYEANRKKKR